MPGCSANYRSVISRYGVALVAVLLAAIIRYSITPWMPQGVPFVTFFLAVMLSAWTGGVGPGLFASFLSALIADFLFIEPFYEFRVDSHYVVSLGVFGLETVAISLMAEKSKKTETSLRKTEMQFRTAFQWASVGKTQIDVANGRFLEVNQAFCRITGYERDELLQMTPQDLTHPDDRCSDTIDAATLLRGARDQYGLEKRYIRKDGSVIWVQEESALIRSPDGQPQGTIAVILDITARKHAEEIGRWQTAQFETLLNQAPLGVYLVDADFRIVQMNPVARPVFGDIPGLIGSDFTSYGNHASQLKLWPFIATHSRLGNPTSALSRQSSVSIAG